MANIVKTEAWATVSSTKGTALPETNKKILLKGKVFSKVRYYINNNKCSLHLFF